MSSNYVVQQIRGINISIVTTLLALNLLRYLLEIFFPFPSGIKYQNIFMTITAVIAPRRNAKLAQNGPNDQTPDFQ